LKFLQLRSYQSSPKNSFALQNHFLEEEETSFTVETSPQTGKGSKEKNVKAETETKKGKNVKAETEMKKGKNVKTETETEMKAKNRSGINDIQLPFLLCH
jgi:hypothetical protein